MRATQAPLVAVERIALLVAVGLALGLLLPLHGYITDDTYIHLRFAQHLARGEGLVFNAGERVYGCTSPLWVALVADGIALGIDGLWTAKMLGLLATLASIGFFLQLMRRTVSMPEVRALATIAWGGHAWMARWAISGMETPLAVALVLAGFVAFTEGQQWGSRPVRTGTLWALGALTRPEVALLLGLWGIFLIADTENRLGIRRLVFGAVPPILIYGAWLLFARLYFGSFWPQTLTAKVAGVAGRAFATEDLKREIQIIGATDGILIAALLLSLLVGFRRLLPGRMLGQRLVPWAWVLAVPALYVARGVPVISRYLLPLLPVAGWLAWRTLEIAFAGEPVEPAKRTRTIAIASVLAVAVLVQNAYVYRTRVLPHVVEFSAGMQNGLVRWGKWFGEHTPRGTVIATPDIGAIGYFSDRPVLDLAGLVTPGMVPILERLDTQAIADSFAFAAVGRPDYLVDRASPGEELTKRSPYGGCLTKLGEAEVEGLGINRPGRTVYSFYRIEWSCFDSLRAARAAPR